MKRNEFFKKTGIGIALFTIPIIGFPKKPELTYPRVEKVETGYNFILEEGAKPIKCRLLARSVDNEFEEGIYQMVSPILRCPNSEELEKYNSLIALFPPIEMNKHYNYDFTNDVYYMHVFVRRESISLICSGKNFIYGPRKPLTRNQTKFIYDNLQS